MPATFRAEHVGSLLRPPGLLQARAAYAAGALPLEQLRAAEDLAILEVLERQRQLGLDAVTDGEFRRGSWLTDMADAVEGFVRDRVVLEWKGPGGGPEGSTAHAAGTKLRKMRNMTEHEVPSCESSTAVQNYFARAIQLRAGELSGRDHRKILCNARRAAEGSHGDYSRRSAVAGLQGVSYIQFDAPYYTHYLDPQHRARMQAEGRDPDQELEKAIRG